MINSIIDPISADKLLNIEIKAICETEKSIIRNTNQTQLLYVLSGTLLVSFRTFVHRELCAGETVLFPISSNYILEAVEDTQYVVFNCQMDNSICKHFSLEMLVGYIPTNYEYDFTILKPKRGVKLYWDLLVLYNDRGVLNLKVKDFKKQELLILYKLYYSKEELAKFFYPIISADFLFNEFIHRNYLTAPTIGELAQRSKYSLSGFIKRFKQCYKMDPKTWIFNQKKDIIYHDLLFPDHYTAAEITENYNFSSVSQFHQFCKKAYGVSVKECGDEKE
jgi:AraC-like DNA-binding protein